jgi:multiple sugar transport system ATP-binding protein
VRPEHLDLAEAGAPDTVPAEIVVVEPTGAETELVIDVGGAQLVLVTHGRLDVNPGDRVGLRVHAGAAHLFDRATGKRIAS